VFQQASLYNQEELKSELNEVKQLLINVLTTDRMRANQSPEANLTLPIPIQTKEELDSLEK